MCLASTGVNALGTMLPSSEFKLLGQGTGNEKLQWVQNRNQNQSLRRRTVDQILFVFPADFSAS